MFYYLGYVTAQLVRLACQIQIPDPLVWKQKKKGGKNQFSSCCRKGKLSHEGKPFFCYLSKEGERFCTLIGIAESVPTPG